MKRPFALTDDDKAAFDALPAHWRSLLAAAGTGTNYEQLALDFNLKLGTVKSRIHRARSQIIAAREMAEAE
ncbi:hypothetical protein RPMA_12265 [Tardiphaga alba]|uniref:RNA polymerase sigma factor 70 region 4 type 2 domain-containing protein n=1 Tax=Tardiphaga alba TaxID=340268 RepID=A0ABX8A936_9BRAD|nr:hypothetical protein [Tardiphaga alba]QUS39521.1 hypothetical protein RPMA_12265 [Tardiphaga alba]